MPTLVDSLLEQTPLAPNRAYDFFLQYLNLPPAPRILDLGSGSGNGTAFLAQRIPQAKVFGLDLSFDSFQPEKLDSGSQSLAFMQAGAPDFPLATNSLDAVIIVMTFHCLPQPSLVMSTIARVLRPGGALVIAEVNGEHWMAHFFEWIEHLFVSPLTHAWNADELRILAQQSGLADVTFYHRSDKKTGFMQWMIARKSDGVFGTTT